MQRPYERKSIHPSTHPLPMTSSPSDTSIIVSMDSAIDASPERRSVTMKLILFSFGQQILDGNLPVFFGVHIHSVQHIYGNTTIYSSGKTPAGIAHVDQQEITTLDLCRYLFDRPLPEVKYLLALRSPDTEAIGVPLSESPVLVEVAAENIRSLPATYRHLDPLGLADQVAIAETEDGPQTAFLIDIKRLVGLMMEAIE